jgi:hypothetical protein
MPYKTPEWKNEDSVNNWVNSQLEKLGLKRDIDFFTESNMSEKLKESLKGSAKTAKKTTFGKPDFHTEKYSNGRKQNAIPVIIENKVKLGKLIAETKDGIKFDDAAIAGNAVNGALYYARNMISSGKYRDVIAVGVAGDNIENVKIKVYYVYGFGENSYKFLPEYQDFSFLENQTTFDDFYKNASLSDEDKH